MEVWYANFVETINSWSEWQIATAALGLLFVLQSFRLAWATAKVHRLQLEIIETDRYAEERRRKRAEEDSRQLQSQEYDNAALRAYLIQACGEEAYKAFEKRVLRE